ncbi:hypothetical protein [Massilia sp. SYSU DXS3249]
MRGMHLDGLAAAAPFPRRPLAPLALTLGLHLLLVLAWLGGAPHQPAGVAPPREQVFVFVQPVARPRPAQAVPQASSQPRPRPDNPAESATVAAPSRVPPMSRSEPEAITQPPADGEAPASEPASDSTSHATSRPAPAPGDLLATSKAMAGSVDRALRKGSSPITAEPDRKWERFAEAFAAARKDVGNTVTLDSYTAPDGVIIYRKTAGSRVACYRSGSAGGPVTASGRPLDTSGAGSVPCPTGVPWMRQ